MFASFQKKYFLSDKGVAGVKRGIFWTALANLIAMAGMGLLFLVMAGFVEHLATGADLPDALPIVGGLLVFFVLLFASNWQQYYYTYCIFYEECGKQRMEIAERLRKLPLSFFGRRDLADLTETIMGDVQAMEHAYSHVLGELWGAIIASAIVFQDVLLFDDTVMGNIRLGRRDATDEKVLAAARAANCDEFVSRMPQGYDTMIGENGSKLSGGERQRISIARALLKDAPIVLLDEATASLDVENETVVQQALSRLLAGKTVIVIAHRMRTVENADKIVVLKDGVVAEQGTPAQLKAAGGEFARMVALQKEAATWQL